MPRRPALPLRAIDLFCGAGGLSEGLRLAGFEVPFALDFDEDSCATYRHNHPDTHVECASITDFSPAEIAKLAGGRVDVVVGGPSCQGFSTAGRRTGWVRADDERNSLWEHMFAVVEHLRPRGFLMENVPGMVYWKDGAFGDRILKRFRELGYAVTKEILLAADYGVPQRRRRLFIVGLLGDTEFAFPEPTHLGGWRRDTLDLWEAKRERLGLLPHLTVADAIGDLPSLGDSAGPINVYAHPAADGTPYSRAMRGRCQRLRDHEIQPLSADYAELVRHVPIGGTWREIPPHLLPDRYRGMRRTDSTNLLGRLDPDLPAYTITTQFNNVTTGCFTHPYENRALSVREGARLQSFPDRYEFVGSLISRCRQIGNAVPPLLAGILVSEMARQIAGPKALEFHPRPSAAAHGAHKSAPPPIDELTRRRMRRQARQDTAAERLVQEAVKVRGLAFRTHVRPEPGMRRTADLVIEDARVVVLVNGCFWHGCPEHSRQTKSHTKWWADKIAANKDRDAETERLWRDAGWIVVTVWEHEDPDDAARHIEEVVVAARTSKDAWRHRPSRGAR